jgi:hypothetical protein
VLDPFVGNAPVVADGEYPKAAYRLGTDVDIWGRMMDIRSLASREDERQALHEGWALHPLDISDEEPLTVEHVEAPKRGPGRPRKTEA